MKSDYQKLITLFELTCNQQDVDAEQATDLVEQIVEEQPASVYGLIMKYIIGLKSFEEAEAYWERSVLCFSSTKNLIKKIFDKKRSDLKQYKNIVYEQANFLVFLKKLNGIPQSQDVLDTYKDLYTEEQWKNIITTNFNELDESDVYIMDEYIAASRALYNTLSEVPDSIVKGAEKFIDCDEDKQFLSDFKEVLKLLKTELEAYEKERENIFKTIEDNFDLIKLNTLGLSVAFNSTTDGTYYVTKSAKKGERASWWLLFIQLFITLMVLITSIVSGTGANTDALRGFVDVFFIIALILIWPFGKRTSNKVVWPFIFNLCAFISFATGGATINGASAGTVGSLINIGFIIPATIITMVQTMKSIKFYKENKKDVSEKNKIINNDNKTITNKADYYKQLSEKAVYNSVTEFLDGKKL